MLSHATLDLILLAQNAPDLSAARAFLKASDEGPSLPMGVSVNPRAVLFRRSLETLGLGKAPSNADESPEAEVVRIARDRAARPELFSEIENEYTRVDNPMRHAPRARGARPEHLSANYRLAWEYMLLRSSFIFGAPGYGNRALDALSAIHDDASLPLIVDGFKRECARFRDRGEGYRHDVSVGGQGPEKDLFALERFVSVRGLDALIECADASEEAQKGIVAEPAFWVDAIEIVRRILRPRRPSAESAAWQKVIEEYERTSTKRDRVERLRRILAATGTRKSRSRRMLSCRRENVATHRKRG